MSAFWLIYSLLFVAIVPAIYGFIKYRFLPDYARVLVWIMLLTFLNEVIALFFDYYRDNNMPVYYFYFALLSIGMGMYFKTVLSEASVLNWFYGCAALCLLEFILFDSDQFNNYSSFVVSAVSVFYCFRVLYKIIIKEAPYAAIHLTSVVLLFFFYNGLQWALMRYLQATNEMDIIWEFVKITSFMNAFCYLSLTYILWSLSKYSSSVQS